MTAPTQRPAEFENRIAANKDWREIVAWVGDLPPMPHVASKAMSMVENPDTTAPQLEELLNTDAALAARVLKIANSAMFSRQREITTLTQAIMIIGFKALKGIIVAATLRQLNKRSGPAETMVWQNSTLTAMFSNMVAKKLRKRYVDEVFLLGLLHNLGQMVLLTQLSKEYTNVIKVIQERGLDYFTAETETLGFAHPLIGALVAKKWNFSAETCQVILHYKDPFDGQPTETEQEEKTLIVTLADLLAHASGIGSPPGYKVDREAMETMAKALGFDPKGVQVQLDELIAAGKEQHAKESGIFG
jgi:HD-like signal output (HDOD) protein